ncbi:hypothetical protein BGZ61DRAFT_526207 [Ilyonectria robusta]|uniref:uncharacterized protein n=1 Tax=Ilyonectria robusta TaxID=1079257 RepID=UPI001E8D2E4F|nr:uncharacterized protein BGZ61DRAFT_526207 [Ilyonectria robusta]KAH8738215.1 hypothetical protein BGZ61DRAFT_526207 [Ilyonectria robusta]
MEDPTPGLKLKGFHRAATRSDDPFQSQDTAPGICRICRGEGTPEEPLFYPCKCSGSIKFVHQDCLMEWLSHSQKKYCELCKTSFRFTKLYAPDMPQSLPVHVFVGHMAKYLLRNVLVWLRAVMAISVWVFWLPYLMRSVWSFMFWVSDEGLGASSMLSGSNETVAATVELAQSAFGNDTCPASPLFVPVTTSAAVAQAMLDGLSGQNISEFLLRVLLNSLYMSSKYNRSESGDSATSADGSPIGTTPPSLLGDVTFLHNLTRNPTLNRTLVYVLEGQIITVLVIVCFILVILVRDYVVQQQPEINMRAAFAAPENPLAAQEPILVRQEDAEDLRGLDESDEETLDDGELIGPVEVNDPRLGPSYARQPQAGFEDTGAASVVAPEPWPQVNSSALEERTSVHEYLRIYRLADGDPQRILQIVEDEGLEEKLAYWVDITRRSIPGQEASIPELAALHRRPELPLVGDRPESSGSTGESSSRIALTPGSNEGSAIDMEEHPAASRKGKERESLPIPDIDADPWTGLVPGPSRPRAVSDGPKLHDTINPLANNSWSFAALPSESEAEDLYARQYRTNDRPSFFESRSPSSDRIPETGSSSSLSAEFEDPEHRRHSSKPDITFEERPSNVHNAHQEQAANHRNPEEAVEQDNERAHGLVDRVTEFMWGDLEDHHHIQAEAINHVAAADANDDAWVDVDEADAADDNADVQPEDLDGIPGDGLDPEAIEDLEDFEGVMELIGMRGPIAGLFQNAIFCAVLVSVTIFACIFIPYNIGRVSVWILANPMRLVRLLFELSKLLQDAAVMFAGLASWVALNLLDMFTNIIGGFVASQVVSARKASWALWTSAGSRVLEYAFMDFPMSASEMQNFSAISHGALLTVKGHIGTVLSTVSEAFTFVFGGHIFYNLPSLPAIASFSGAAWNHIRLSSSVLLNPNAWVINLGEAETSPSINPELADWSGVDRFWAILAGYVTLFFIGAMYLKRGSPFSRGNLMQAWEAGVIDTLHQASGIMKVIMIISIEMLVFPLYCGLLLDGALLPLFEDTTFKSRMLFTYNYPLTSVFVHWFVGTGYMFHFALFVSMCRKIMRQGVLYFIRDPDDPEFHPVRDVLERNLTTQLRKILFSAFVYGALVVVCLGGVVWGLSYTLPNVLPIHYSSNEPVLEFPVDLLFYNFLMPLAVNFFKPGDGLHAMYTWWFRTCARGLRLTFFLFGERRIDEEGSLQLGVTSEYHALPWYRTLFLELDKNHQVTPKTWKDAFDGGDAKPKPPLTQAEMSHLRRKKARLRDSSQILESGHFVRAPASDRVKIPKGRRVFLDVSERGVRLDRQLDTDLYSSNQYQMVYIPPNFRARVFLFILFIWIFAAVTGVGFTIIPLVFGRRMFKMLIPSHIRTNDIYAFSIGVYLLGSLAYLVFHIKSLWAKAHRWFNIALEQVAMGGAPPGVTSVILHGCSVLYSYFLLLVVFPLLVSAIMELYLAIPLHTYMYPPTAASIQASRDGAPEASRHTVRVIQAWTLGVLYLKLSARMVTTLFADTRLAVAVRTVLREGWLYPDASVLTRAFVVPGLAISVAAVFGPPAITTALIKYGMIAGAQAGLNEAAEAARLAIIYRQSYPAVALAALLIKNTIGLVRVFHGWSARIRDEAYLIGERLHNFGAAAAGARRVRGAWRAGGARL